MKRLFASALLLIAAGLASAPLHATEVNLNVYPFSWRQMGDGDLWDDLQNQYAIGGMVDFGRKDSPLHFVVGLHTGVGAQDFSNPLLNDAVATESELSFGMTGVWHRPSGVCPYISGGLSFINSEVTLDAPGGDLSENDESLGFFVEGGVYWRLGAHFNLGMYGRLLAGTKTELFGVEGDSDYWQIGPMIGWSWPPKS